MLHDAAIPVKDSVPVGVPHPHLARPSRLLSVPLTVTRGNAMSDAIECLEPATGVGEVPD